MDDVLCALRARGLTACRRFGRLPGAGQGAGGGSPQAPYNPLPPLYVVTW